MGLSLSLPSGLWSVHCGYSSRCSWQTVWWWVSVTGGFHAGCPCTWWSDGSAAAAPLAWVLSWAGCGCWSGWWQHLTAAWSSSSPVPHAGSPVAWPEHHPVGLVWTHETGLTEHMTYWAYGLLGIWLLGHNLQGIYGLLGIWLTGHMTYWAYDLLGIWLTGHMAYWAYGLLGICLIGHMAYWAYDLLGIWLTGNLAYWAYGLLTQ